MKGPIRTMLDHLQTWAGASGLTLEQVADLFDRVNAIAGQTSSTDAPPSTLATMTPAKGKH